MMEILNDPIEYSLEKADTKLIDAKGYKHKFLYQRVDGITLRGLHREFHDNFARGLHEN